MGQSATRGVDLGRRWAGMAVRPILLAAVLLALYLWVHAQTLDSIERRALDPQEFRLELWQHVQLSLVSTALTIAIAVPLGALLSLDPPRKYSRVVTKGFELV